MPQPLAHAAHPLAGVYRRSPISRIREQGERDVGADVARQVRRASVGRPLTIMATSADARAAHEVELQRRIRPLADLGLAR
jgi:hypothetical protein